MDKKQLIIAASVLLLLGVMLVPRKVWAAPARANPYLADIAAAEFSHDLPPQLLARLLYQESRYRPDIISGEIFSDLDKSGTLTRNDAQGIAQIVPRWHPAVNPLNAQDAIYYAAGYLARLFDQYGSWQRALAAYNWGPGNVSNAIDDYGDKWLMFAPRETQNYVTDILSDVEVRTA